MYIKNNYVFAYVGPFIDVVPKTYTPTKKVSFCPNCNNNDCWGKYCHSCGTELKKRTVKLEPLHYQLSDYLIGFEIRIVNNQILIDFNEKNGGKIISGIHGSHYAFPDDMKEKAIKLFNESNENLFKKLAELKEKGIIYNHDVYYGYVSIKLN